MTDYDEDLEYASFSGTAATTRSTRTVNENSIAAKESRAVSWQRLVVFSVLLGAAIGVSTAVFILTNTAEQKELKGNFKGNALKIVDSFQAIAGQKFAELGSLSIAYTAYARTTDSDFPFVTMTDFPQQVASVRSLSEALIVLIAPIVTREQREDWIDYSLNNTQWLNESYAYQSTLGFGASAGFNPVPPIVWHNNFEPVSAEKDVLTPVWQASPLPAFHYTNNDLFIFYDEEINATITEGVLTIHSIQTSPPGDIDSENPFTAAWANLLSVAAGEQVSYAGDPISRINYPVFDSFDQSSRATRAYINAAFNWAGYFKNILPPTTPGVVVVLENPCDGPYTYEIQGENVLYIGQGDFHIPDWDDIGITAPLSGKLLNSTLSQDKVKFDEGECPHQIRVYPSQQFASTYATSAPILYSCCVAAVFLFTTLMFVLYHYLVERRNTVVMKTANDTNAIVQNIFPKGFRDRVLQHHASSKRKGFEEEHWLKEMVTPRSNNGLSDFLQGSDPDQPGASRSRALAELYPEATILFADVVGFTAWSSVRSPSQVFTLLETIFGAFDSLAKLNGVYKVETVGDCYVAVSGVPEPRREHAVTMCRFARRCMSEMHSLVKKLEVSLGPDTAELSIRMGIQSGPVTAGVLRGDRARFQLFGDTMNTCARIETTGAAGAIHIGEQTAALLSKAGKGHWCRPREDVVLAKGKGEMKTYWLALRGDPRGDNESDTSFLEGMTNSEDNTPEEQQQNKCARLIEWNKDTLKKLLQQIVSHREAKGGRQVADKANTLSKNLVRDNHTVLEEVKEIIQLPKYDPQVAQRQKDPKTVVLNEDVMTQLENYIQTISSLYHDNYFHNFEHASHVAMSVSKLLSRIVMPVLDLKKDDNAGSLRTSEIASKMHDHTYGITSDPLTQFAVVFSALIHDVDHLGVPNAQLIKEGVGTARLYKNKSVAEQNSVDLSWSLLQQDEYAALRQTIYQTEGELNHFRQLVVNTVLATDIVDRELKELRNSRWAKAFNADNIDQDDGCSIHAATSRKATIVIEHLIQASDVSHTMQHWNVYLKWNERLFKECYQAYSDGRADVDPSVGWYKGEIGFFDFYIIPLAKKLKDCGVFGVSSDEYLNYAISNRKEWEAKGQQVVAEMVANLKPKEEVDDEV